MTPRERHDMKYIVATAGVVILAVLLLVGWRAEHHKPIVASGYWPLRATIATFAYSGPRHVYACGPKQPPDLRAALAGADEARFDIRQLNVIGPAVGTDLDVMAAMMRQ
jgi:hypothetical protein